MHRTAIEFPLLLTLAGACAGPGPMRAVSPDEPLVVEVLVGGVT